MLFRSQTEQPGTQTVIDVVIVVCQLIGQIGQLRFERWTAPLDEPFADIAELTGIFQRAMLQYSLTGFKTQIQPVESSIALLKQIDDPQRLQIVFEPPVGLHTTIQRILAGMTKGRVPEVMRKRNRFDKIFVQLQTARDRSRDIGA